MYKPVEAIVDFPSMEKEWLKKWEESGVIEKYLHKNDKAKKNFSFLDGPITANNPMGVHHAWGRSYKDLWQKFYNLLGYKQRFRNGFDCQGLWVEVEVEKELGTKNKKDIENLIPGDKKGSIAKFVQMCKDRVMKYSAIQTEQSKRLGYFMDWDNSYFTMSPENNYMIWHFLKVCHENGWIYKGHESVPWCPRCETAISQHEMLTEDYKEVVHESIYFKLPIVGKKNEYLLVWTTTPWTIPANIAIAVDAKKEYIRYPLENNQFVWVMNDAADRLVTEGILPKDNSKREHILGEKMVGWKYSGPFDDLPAVKNVADEHPKTFHTVIATDHLIMPISATEGTGMVHTAVSAGTEDFMLGKKYGLPMIPVIADNADYLDGFGDLSGKNAKKHPELIIDFLKNYEGGQFLLTTHRYKHRYPACWRCKAELVWKVADEWYIAMDVATHDGRTLRQRMVEVAKKIHWMPEFGLDRELDWLKNMHDWLISKKNRFWGLALPIYECKKCNTFEVIGGYDELKERAVSGWNEFEGQTPHKPYIDEVKIKCKSCGEVVDRINDVGNVWLDAGIVPFSTILDPKTNKLSYLVNRDHFNQWFPADFITESFPGQFKNWFYSMIAMSSVLEDTNPFKNVLGFATLQGEDGRPMHKSWGNSIEFNEGADKIGVDVMRWMYARQNPTDNMLFGYKKADEVRRQFYLMLWNSFKFFVDYANQDGYDRRQSIVDSLQTKSSHVLDQWIMNRFVWLVSHVEEQLKSYNAQLAALEIEKFVNDLSTWYIRRSRDRVGANSDNDDDKQAFYSTLESIFANFAIILSPIMPFLTEYIYTKITKNESVHLSEWPDIKKTHTVDKLLLKDMELVREVVELGHKLRKEKQLKVRQPLVSITVQLPKEKHFQRTDFVAEYEDLITQELNIKKVVWEKSNTEEMVGDLDTTITPELKLEGELRDLIRSIQQERKTRGIALNATIVLTIPEKFAPFKDLVAKKVLARTITLASETKVE